MFDYFKRRPAPAPAATEVPIPAQPAVARPEPAPPVPAGPVLNVRLAAVCEFWPEAIRQEITQAKWNGAFVAVPMNRLETAIKTGRVIFTWGELRQWLDLAASPGSSPHRDTALELPLKAMVPLFLSHLPAPASRKKVAPGDKIPDLFIMTDKPAGQPGGP